MDEEQTLMDVPSDIVCQWMGEWPPDTPAVFSRSSAHTRVLGWRWGGRSLVEKTHLDPARAHRELSALQPPGPAATLGRSPAVLDVATAPDGSVVLLLEFIAAPPPPMQPQVFRAAGAWLAALHALPVSAADHMPLSTALKRRWKGLLRRSRRHAHSTQLTAIQDMVGDPGLLSGDGRSFCHRDFTPDNWLWQGASEEIWVIDFEHSRPDTPMSDLVKLEADVFVHHPQLREPFYAGYGPPPPERALLAWRAWHGLATWTWGMRQSNPQFQRLGADVLSALGVELPRPPVEM